MSDSYVDFAYYFCSYQGRVIPEKEFIRLAFRASERVDYLTRYRAAAYFKSNPSPIKNATCAIAEVLLQVERGNLLLLSEADDAPIKSEATGKHHVTYADKPNTASQEGQRATDKAIMTAAYTHLLYTGLLYRGVI